MWVIIMIYLDNAATTFPKPRATVEAVARAMMLYGANPGRSAHRLSLRAAHEVWGCREKLARLIGASDPTHIIFCLNCTDALNMAIQGNIKPGMHVITTALEHNSVLRQLAPLKRSGNIELTILQPDQNGTVTVEQFEQAFTPQTGLVVCTHASNVTGAIQPVAGIGALCRKRGVRFVLDAAQTAGMLDINASAIGCDLIAMPGHKGLYGPMGTGVLYIRPGIEVTPLRLGGTGSSSQSVYQPSDLPERMESGTLNLPGITGLSAGLDFVIEQGALIRERERMLTAQLLDGLHRIPGARVLGPQTADARAGVVSFNIGALPSTDVADALNTLSDNEAQCIAVRAGLHCAPLVHEYYGTLEQGAVRVSVGAFNNSADIETLLAALLDIARNA